MSIIITLIHVHSSMIRRTVRDFQMSVIVSVAQSVKHVDGHLNGLSGELSTGLSVDVSVQVSAEMVGVFIKSRAH